MYQRLPVVLASHSTSNSHGHVLGIGISNMCPQALQDSLIVNSIRGQFRSSGKAKWPILIALSRCVMCSDTWKPARMQYDLRTEGIDSHSFSCKAYWYIEDDSTYVEIPDVYDSMLTKRNRLARAHHEWARDSVDIEAASIRMGLEWADQWEPSMDSLRCRAEVAREKKRQRSPVRLFALLLWMLIWSVRKRRHADKCLGQVALFVGALLFAGRWDMWEATLT